MIYIYIVFLGGRGDTISMFWLKCVAPHKTSLIFPLLGCKLA